MSLILRVGKYCHWPSLTAISSCDKDSVNKLVKEQNRDHNMENDIRTKTGSTESSAVERVDEGKKTEEDEGWSVEEVAESREEVGTVVDWPAAVAVNIASISLVEGVAEDDEVVL